MASSRTLLLSIIIPVFNRQDKLKNLLLDLQQAIEEGHYENELEVIVVDDYSVPPLSLSSRCHNVRIVRNQKNEGAPYSRAIGFKISSGSFIHFHDSDDSINQDWLAGVLKALKLSSETDLLLTGRKIYSDNGSRDHYQKFFHRHVKKVNKIKHRLDYQNCIGPLGGVTFSREALTQIDFKNYSSCQDWQMYISIMPYVKKMNSCPEITFGFNTTGNDRISQSPRKKLLGHLQLSRITSTHVFTKRLIRFFYLYNCRSHIYSKGGNILRFYKKNQLKIFGGYLLTRAYWKFTELVK